MFGLKLGLPRRSPPKEGADSNASTPPASALPPIASAVVLAAGAGVAFWWWTQWARGRAESPDDLTDADADPPKGAD